MPALSCFVLPVYTMTTTGRHSEFASHQLQARLIRHVLLYHAPAKLSVHIRHCICAGNLLVLRDGRLGFIDFGIVGKISPVTFQALEAFLMSTMAADYNTMARALITMGVTQEAVVVEVRPVCLDFLSSHQGYPDWQGTVAAHPSQCWEFNVLCSMDGSIHKVGFGHVHYLISHGFVAGFCRRPSQPVCQGGYAGHGTPDAAWG